jgi:alkanesulfonate monooxygenase SsuD/methylene tetrahydromethanopterin reductase-like flavin-dependent oxidoreductase (luciferase family)
VATALQQVTEVSMGRAYDRLDPADYGPNWSEEDFEYTWSWIQEVRGLWSRAATAGRAVIFTVSQ